MDIFKQNKMLQRLVILLLILNLGSWTALWYASKNRNNHPPQKDIGKLTELLTEKLDLTHAQAKKLKAIRLGFFRKEERLGESLRAKRDSLNAMIFNKNWNENEIDLLAQRIAAGEYQMERYRIEQAAQLKALCNPKQQEKLEELVLEIRDYFQPVKKLKAK